MSLADTRTRSNWILFAYGLPGLITSIPIVPISILLPSFYADELGLGFVLTGITLAIARLLDILSDIVVGIGIDRFKWRGYRFKPSLIIGACLSAISLFQLSFVSPSVSATHLLVWSITLFLGWTMMMIPYTAWGAELSSDRFERSLITTSREIAGVVGIIVAICVPLALTFAYPELSLNPLQAIAIVTILLGVPALLMTCRSVPEPDEIKFDSNAINAVQLSDVAALIRFEPTRYGLICWFLNSFANGLPAVLFPVVVDQYFQLSETQLLILLLVYFGAAITLAPLWLRISNKLGKRLTWAIAITVNVAFFAQVPLLGPETWWVFALVCFATGGTLGADLALPPSLQADILESDRHVNKRVRTATAFALWSMSTKLALAFAVGIGFVGFGLSQGDASSATSDIRLLALYIALPISIKLGVLAMLLKSRSLIAIDRNPLSQKSQHAANYR